MQVFDKMFEDAECSFAILALLLCGSFILTVSSLALVLSHLGLVQFLILGQVALMMKVGILVFSYFSTVLYRRTERLRLRCRGRV